MWGAHRDDHLQFFGALDDPHAVLAPHFRQVELRTLDYRLPYGHLRREAFWRCAQDARRLDEARWRQFGPVRA